VARAMDEEMESRGDLTSPGARTTFASAPAAVPATGCRAGVITELAVVIRVYNEAAAILETIDEVGKPLPECGLEAFEIVVVDEGSSDWSAELMADLSHVRVVRHPCNAGYGRALKSGINAPLATRLPSSYLSGRYVTPFAERVPKGLRYGGRLTHRRSLSRLLDHGPVAQFARVIGGVYHRQTRPRRSTPVFACLIGVPHCATTDICAIPSA
jgi:hypothetical protein